MLGLTSAMHRAGQPQPGDGWRSPQVPCQKGGAPADGQSDISALLCLHLSSYFVCRKAPILESSLEQNTKNYAMPVKTPEFSEPSIK